MSEAGVSEQSTSKVTRVSYLFMVGLFIVVAALHLATPLLAALFGYLALSKLHFVHRPRGKYLAVALFLLLMAGILYGLGRLISETILTLPKIAETAIPSIITWAKQHQIELPFTDYDSLKDAAFDIVKNEVGYLGSAARFARGATAQLVFVVVGGVVAISVFLNPRFELGRLPQARENNLYSACCAEIGRRFSVFYQSFNTVMGAQIAISAINTVFTAIFVLALQLPYSVWVIGLTFFCGLLPIVGTLVSNTIIVGIGFTVSPKVALAALVFLVVIHKLEYLLNSKIIGKRIRNPFWLTLLALVIGERLMGVPGMVLAPVVLNYLKLELSAIEVEDRE